MGFRRRANQTIIRRHTRHSIHEMCGAYLFWPDARPAKPLYAMVYDAGTARRDAVWFFSLRGRRANSIPIPVSIAKAHGQFIPLVAFFNPHANVFAIPTTDPTGIPPNGNGTFSLPESRQEATFLYGTSHQPPERATSGIQRR